MAFVTYELQNNARLVVGVFKTQAEANTEAAAKTGVSAHSGSVNDNVEPGRYIDTRGRLLSAIPAAVRDAGVTAKLRGDIKDAFREAMATIEAGEWRRFIQNDGANVTAARTYAYHQAAFVWWSVNPNRHTQTTFWINLTEHAVKQLRTDLYRWFGKNVSTANRNAWNTTGTSDGAQIYTDLVNAQIRLQTPDGSRRARPGATIPTGFIDLIYTRS